MIPALRLSLLALPCLFLASGCVYDEEYDSGYYYHRPRYYRYDDYGRRNVVYRDGYYYNDRRYYDYRNDYRDRRYYDYRDKHHDNWRDDHHDHHDKKKDYGRDSNSPKLRAQWGGGWQNHSDDHHKDDHKKKKKHHDD